MMDKQLNLTALEEYSRNLAFHNADIFFSDKSSIKGKEILNFCNFKQINLFLIKLLFEKWQKSIEESKSPFFDYEHPDVQKALVNYSNALSQHISVNKADFTDLLQQATYDCLFLILNPYEFYINEIGKFRTQTIETEKLKNAQKYIQINKILFQELLNDLEHHKTHKIATSELITSFKIVFQANKHANESIEQFLTLLENLYPVNLDAFFIEEPYQAQKTTSKEPLIIVKEPKQTEEKNLKATNNHLLYEDEQEEPSNISTLNDRFKQTVFTLNDQLKINNPVDNIRNIINLNQRFRFINHLFAGNHTTFNQFIIEIEHAHDLNDAMAIFQKNQNMLNWGDDLKETEEMLEVIRKCFS